jgi:hypothetical protein
VFGLLANNLHAALIKIFSIDEKCNSADLIIEGIYLGNDMVQVDKIYKNSPKLESGASKIKINLLDKHDRAIGKLFNPQNENIKATHLVVFLKYSDMTSTWESFATIDINGVYGSSGLFWFDNSTCYGYLQIWNPGPYCLISGDGNRIPKTIEDMREQIKIGLEKLENAKNWADTLAIQDPLEKARALSKYLLKSTAPKNDKGTYLYYVHDIILKIGKIAAPVVVAILENAQEDDNLNETVRILRGFGPDAKPAVPFLCKLLGSLKRANPNYISWALQAINDPAAVPLVRPFIKHENFETAVCTCQVLAFFKYAQSFDNMAALVPTDPNTKGNNLLNDLLNALYDLDPERAKPIIKKTSELPGLKDWHFRLKGLK